MARRDTAEDSYLHDSGIDRAKLRERNAAVMRERGFTADEVYHVLGVGEAPVPWRGREGRREPRRRREPEPCVVCGGPGKPHKLTCSRSCAAKLQWRTKRRRVY